MTYWPQDLFYIILSLSILWFTIFLCWLLYQAARVLKNANNIIENVTDKLELITDAVGFIRDRVDGVSKTLGTVNSMVAGLVEQFVVGALSRKLKERAGRTGQKKRKISEMDEDDE